jgi:hypothetical protein
MRSDAVTPKLSLTIALAAAVIAMVAAVPRPAQAVPPHGIRLRAMNETLWTPSSLGEFRSQTGYAAQTNPGASFNAPLHYFMNLAAGAIVSNASFTSPLRADLLVNQASTSSSSSSSTSSSSSSSSSSSGGTTVIAISCGGKAASPYVADTDFNGGSVSSGTTHAITTTGVTDPAPQEVYQHSRDGNFTYTIPSLTAGAAYTVRLHFCEYYWNAAGKREFNVSINGTQVLTDFDIFKAAGGQYIAIVEPFTANANSSGQIVIAYTTVINNSQQNGIQIETTSGSSAATSSTAAASSTAATSSAATSSNAATSGSSTSSAGYVFSPQTNSDLFINATEISQGASVEMENVDGFEGSMWNYIAGTGTSEIQIAGDPAFCLQSEGNTSGSELDIWSCNSSAAEEFTNYHDPSPNNEYYQLQQPVAGGTLCVDALGTASPSSVEVVTCNGSAGQQWFEDYLEIY